MKKLLNKNQLKKKVKYLHNQDKKVVTTNGSFDILHAGHIYLLKKAKSLGDVLVVGLNSDYSIKRCKGKDRPIITQKFRAELLSVIEYVDHIYIFNEINPIKFLEIVKPDIHVNSSEYGRNCVEAPIVKKYGGKLYLLSKKRNLLSTTEIIRKIIKIYHKSRNF